MKKIYKYPIGIGVNYIKSFAGAKVISAGFDPQGQFSVWTIVDIDQPKAELCVLCLGTGWDVPAAATFIDTVQDEEYIWHIFQLEKEENSNAD